MGFRLSDGEANCPSGQLCMVFRTQDEPLSPPSAGQGTIYIYALVSSCLGEAAQLTKDGANAVIDLF